MGPFTRLQYVLSVALTIVLTGIMSSIVVFLVSILVSPGLMLELPLNSRVDRFIDTGLAVFRGIWDFRFSSGQIQRGVGRDDESHVFRIYIP